MAPRGRQAGGGAVSLAPVLRAHGPVAVQKALSTDETRADRIADAVRLAPQGQRPRRSREWPQGDPGFGCAGSGSPWGRFLSPRGNAAVQWARAMKTSLESLPEKKQHQLRALAELIRKEAQVEMVILFGSFARGDAVEDPVGGYFSDFDVLVIVKSPSMVDKLDIWSTIEARAHAITKPTSLSPCSCTTSRT